MRAYLLGVICAAFLCAVVSAIGGEGQGSRKLICGLFLGLSLLHPLGSLDLPELSVDHLREEARLAAQSGTDQADEARNAIITQSLEAYILTEAETLGLQITAQVEMDESGMPASVTLSGDASPLEREELTAALGRALGLGKEELIWKEFSRSSE